MTDIYLNDLENQIKKIWPSSDKWRKTAQGIEFSLKGEKNELVWFPLYQAPQRVEKFVRSWMLIDNENDIELENNE